jgi:hypothetical protein
MFQDTGIENYTAVPEVGNGIGSPGTPNPVITITEPTPSAPYLTVNTVGKGWADGLAKIVRPLLVSPSPKGALTYQYDIMTDTRAPGAAQALETTPRVVFANGNDAPFDFQVNYAEGGMVQIWQSKANPWADTGVKIGLYAPNEWYSVAIGYTYDLEAGPTGTGGVPWFSVNGKVYEVPASMLNVALGTGIGWPVNNIYLQKQLDLNKGGGAYAVSYKNVDILYPGT